MSKILITGGTGLVGKALTESLLKKNHEVIILTRDKDKITTTQQPKLSYAFWDVDKQQVNTEALCSADHIVHLAGANVAEKRWTKERKQEIVDSRVKSGELICNTLRNHPNNLKALVSASAIGWYGPDKTIPNPTPFREDAPHANDFLGETCYLWEQSVEQIAGMGKRLVKLRTGIVLSNDGGALKEFAKPLKFGFATVMGSGRQMISWVHIEDVINLYIQAIEDERFSGVYNAVAPAVVSNKDLIIELAKQKKGKYYSVLYAPKFALKLALGEMSIEILKSTTVSASKLIDEGFHFKYPTISAAISQLVKS